MKKIIVLIAAVLTGASSYAEWSATSHQSELGAVLSTGNTRAQVLNFKQETKRSYLDWNFKFFGHYLYGEAVPAGANAYSKNANNWDAGLRVEKMLDTDLGLYIQTHVEGDEFAEYRRYNQDIGLKYDFWKQSNLDYAFGELGYRFTREIGLSAATPNSQTDRHKIRVYGEYSNQLSDTLLFKLWVELLPDVSDGDNFEMSFEPSIYAILSNVFSLKIGYLGKYDNQPVTASLKKYDSTLTAALVAKF